MALMKNLRIGTKLEVHTTWVLAVSILAVCVVGFRSAEKALGNAEIRALEGIADLKVRAIRELFDRMRSEIGVAQYYFHLKTNLPVLYQFRKKPQAPAYQTARRDIDGQLKYLDVISRWIHNVFLTGPDGRILYVSNTKQRDTYLGDFLADPGNLAFYNAKERIYFTEVFANAKEKGRLSMLVSAPVHDFRGKFAGVVAFDMHMDQINAQLCDTTGLDTSGEILVAIQKQDSAVFLSPIRTDPIAPLNRQILLGSPFEKPLQQAVQGGSGSGRAKDYFGQDALAAWRYIPSLKWGIAAQVSAQEAFAPIRALKMHIYLLALGILAAALILSLSFSRTITRPIARLAETVERILKGEKHLRTLVVSEDEVGMLAKSFNRMLDNQESGEERLQQAQEDLEKRVQERTAQLTQLNEQLAAEITERKAAQERQSLFFYAFTHSTEAMVLTDLEGKALEINPAFTRLFGYTPEEVRNRSLGILRSRHSTDELYQRMWKSIYAEGQWRGEIIDKTISGEEIPVWLTITPVISEGVKIGYMGVTMDLRQKKELEARLVQTERMAAIGKLSAQVAHEIRNPLSTISLNAEILREDLKAMGKAPERKNGGKLREAVELLSAIEKEVTRLGEIAGDYLRFSRLPQLTKQNEDLQQVIKETLDWMQEEAKRRGVQLCYEAKPGAFPCEIDAKQIRQVLLNLVRNAFEAMPQGKTGQVDVVLESGKESSAALLAVRDNGSGMDEETQKRIFDPFFTTKETGSGLGLAVVQQILHEHGGGIWCKSAPGKGATFFMRIPLAQNENGVRPLLKNETKCLIVEKREKGSDPLSAT